MSNQPVVTKIAERRAPKNRSAQPKQSKMRGYKDRDVNTEQFRFLNRGGSDNTANTASMKSASMQVRKVEVINGKKYAVIS